MKADMGVIILPFGCIFLYLLIHHLELIVQNFIECNICKSNVIYDRIIETS